jgi:hypothetical protein
VLSAPIAAYLGWFIWETMNLLSLAAMFITIFGIMLRLQKKEIR